MFQFAPVDLAPQAEVVDDPTRAARRGHLLHGVSRRDDPDDGVAQNGGSLHAAPIDLSVGVSIYALTLAIFILPSAWAVDRVGARVLFTSAIALFTLSSALCGLATAPWFFIAARALQGVGGAFMVPVGRLVVLRTTSKGDLLRATALLTWPGLTAPLLGPPLGGYLAEAISWRAIFFINLPLGLIGVALAMMWTPPLEGGEAKPFDVLGFALAAVALAAH